MITKKTVFILGAGASIPYGLPSGATLRTQLCDLGANQPGALVAHHAQEAGYTAKQVLEFSDAFLRSRLFSIDAFLANRASEYGSLGKVALAVLLCQNEQPSAVIRAIDSTDDWYSALWNAVASGITDGGELAANKVRVITFNYDRSLEYCLHEATKSTFSLSDTAALDAWSKVQILHVYGTLGDFCVEPSDGARPYDPTLTSAAVQSAAGKIRVIPDTRHDDIVFELAQEWCKWAERICFLGFGFDALNIERLALLKVITKKREVGAPLPNLYASSFGKKPAEFAAHAHAMAAGLISWSITHEYWKNLQFLQQTALLLE